ncbi:hypothetical protein ACFQI7_31080 [Paenibacillus allorhizosphaerae]|uniref:Uncharacterized protein n=1 Tax=Paenibacillus allorhizosphaerae TaxID=2849866 RepID=A0ABN7TUY7_9BACL|nr:hypothetical protein [Paenibacillus allorhizosphaerae]CAG7652984.1 hypothetical protein PAECIP111802_05369 [Paenibacillus allorhizosphaerae]
MIRQSYIQGGSEIVLYILCYKGKSLGKPMEWSDAEVRLQQMSRCFNGLEIVPWHANDNAETIPEQHKLG